VVVSGHLVGIDFMQQLRILRENGHRRRLDLPLIRGWQVPRRLLTKIVQGYDETERLGWRLQLHCNLAIPPSGIPIPGLWSGKLT